MRDQKTSFNAACDPLIYPTDLVMHLNQRLAFSETAMVYSTLLREVCKYQDTALRHGAIYDPT